MLVDKSARWIVPSIGDLIFIALLGSLAFTTLSVRLLGDAGIGWHIRTGQLILATHSIPHADPFSSTMAGQSWFAWEWLYDAIVGWLDKIAGLNGVVSSGPASLRSLSHRHFVCFCGEAHPCPWLSLSCSWPYPRP